MRIITLKVVFVDGQKNKLLHFTSATMNTHAAVMTLYQTPAYSPHYCNRVREPLHMLLNFVPNTIPYGITSRTY